VLPQVSLSSSTFLTLSFGLIIASQCRLGTYFSLVKTISLPCHLSLSHLSIATCLGPLHALSLLSKLFLSLVITLSLSPFYCNLSRAIARYFPSIEILYLSPLGPSFSFSPSSKFFLSPFSMLTHSPFISLSHSKHGQQQSIKFPL